MLSTVSTWRSEKLPAGWDRLRIGSLNHVSRHIDHGHLASCAFLPGGIKGLARYQVVCCDRSSPTDLHGVEPLCVSRSNQFLRDTGFIFTHYLLGSGGSSAAGLGNAFAYYVRYSWGVEGALLVFAAIELVRGVLAWHKPSILVYSFALPYFIVISSATVRNPRTFLPVIPFLICSAAILATTVCGQLSQPSPPTRKARTIISLAASLVLVLALVFPAARTIQGISRF